MRTSQNNEKYAMPIKGCRLNNKEKISMGYSERDEDDEAEGMTSWKAVYEGNFILLNNIFEINN